MFAEIIKNDNYRGKMKSFAHVFLGWILVTFLYFLTLFITGNALMNGNGVPTQLKLFNQTQLIMGIALIVIPYVVVGVYSRKFFKKNFRRTLCVSLVPVMMERLLILTIGSFLVTNGGDGTMEGISTLMFIQGEAIPYFTVPYFVCGLVSVFITICISYIPTSSGRVNKI
jgi:undecaprenyl pyrophosphate phosphatase UppP